MTKPEYIAALQAAPTRTETNNADYVIAITLMYLQQHDPEIHAAIQNALSYSGWHHHFDGQPGR